MSLHGILNTSNITEENNDYQPGEHGQISIMPPYLDYIMKGFISMIIILNIPPIIALCFTKVKESNFASVHILSVGLTDFAVGLSLLLALSPTTFNYWDCWGRVLIFLTMYTNSMSQVAAICFQRVLVFHTRAWKSIIKTSTLLVKFELATFLLTFITTVIPFSVFISPREISICSYDNLFHVGIQTMFLYFGIIFTCLESVVILCTTIVIRLLWKHKLTKQRVFRNIRNRPVNENTDVETRAIGTLGIIVSLYVILTTPIHVVMLKHGMSGEAPQREIFLPLMALSCLNSACNPVVYYFRISEIREAFRHIWYKIRRR